MGPVIAEIEENPFSHHRVLSVLYKRPLKDRALAADFQNRELLLQMPSIPGTVQANEQQSLEFAFGTVLSRMKSGNLSLPDFTSIVERRN